MYNSKNKIYFFINLKKIDNNIKNNKLDKNTNFNFKNSTMGIVVSNFKHIIDKTVNNKLRLKIIFLYLTKNMLIAPLSI